MAYVEGNCPICGVDITNEYLDGFDGESYSDFRQTFDCPNEACDIELFMRVEYDPSRYGEVEVSSQ